MRHDFCKFLRGELFADLQNVHNSIDSQCLFTRSLRGPILRYVVVTYDAEIKSVNQKNTTTNLSMKIDHGEWMK